MPYVIAIVIVILGIIIFLWKYGRQSSTHDVYRAKYQRLRDEGYSEEECLFRLLSTRPGWNRFPQDFLRELSQRLRTWENIADFIYLSEKELLDRDAYPRIAQSDTNMQNPDIAMRVVASLLTRDYAASRNSRKNPSQTETALRLGTLIAPEDGIMALKLAAWHYLQEHYREALPLFEHGLKLVDDEMTKFKRLEEVLSRQEMALPSEVFGTDDEIEALVSSCKIMYEHCRQEIPDNLDTDEGFKNT